MQASRPKQIEPIAAVWVWDGSWWPAIVTRALVDRGERLLIVHSSTGSRLPHGRLAWSLATRISAAPTSPALWSARLHEQRERRDNAKRTSANPLPHSTFSQLSTPI